MSPAGMFIFASADLGLFREMMPKIVEIAIKTLKINVRMRFDSLIFAIEVFIFLPTFLYTFITKKPYFLPLKM